VKILRLTLTIIISIITTNVAVEVRKTSVSDCDEGNLVWGRFGGGRFDGQRVAVTVARRRMTPGLTRPDSRLQAPAKPGIITGNSQTSHHSSTTRQL